MHKAPQLELVFVMVIAPSVINIFVFWIYDNMLMAPSKDGEKKKLNSKKHDDDTESVIVKRKTIGTPGADVVDTMKRRIFVRGDRSINFPVKNSTADGDDDEEETVLLLENSDVDDMPQ